MPKFTVEIKEMHNNIFEGIEADDLADALEKAGMAIENGDSGTLEFDRTMQSDMWTVRNEETGDYLQ